MEEGLCEGRVLFHKYQQRSQQEQAEQQADWDAKAALREQRRKQQVGGRVWRRGRGRPLPRGRACTHGFRPSAADLHALAARGHLKSAVKDRGSCAPPARLLPPHMQEENVRRKQAELKRKAAAAAEEAAAKSGRGGKRQKGWWEEPADREGGGEVEEEDDVDWYRREVRPLVCVCVRGGGGACA